MCDFSRLGWRIHSRVVLHKDKKTDWSLMSMKGNSELRMVVSVRSDIDEKSFLHTFTHMKLWVKSLHNLISFDEHDHVEGMKTKSDSTIMVVLLNAVNTPTAVEDCVFALNAVAGYDVPHLTS
eukprot:Blabericola_migrator_1__6090@NODE_3076_length_2059_cov_439_038153_g1923_i0_p2_GENE_NODE_3076_length_2059_cov_439_038153_g1923_i0NODE_3076_length_2059_cov_439_038153_g1923_i0_p2_ORF_typecomplete_len123_score16_38Tet_JBP/PF12851_7/0_15_NODE_3076_length_2059_cov_439_038153_g1923_i07801148